MDPHGICHNFRGRNYDNDLAEVAITIPDHAGTTGPGPGSENPPTTALVDDANRPDTP
jgi:hypothetical protein